MIFFKKQKNIWNKDTRGLTLIETLVAISIFAISVVSLMSVTSQGVTSFTFVKNKLTASYLAQEGVEYIRNVRDTLVNENFVLGWNRFVTDQALGANLCYESACGVSVYPASIYTCSGECDPLYENTTTGYFSNSIGGVVSPYRRTISIVSTGINQVRVTSTVRWGQGNRTHEVQVTELLFNWRGSL